MARETQWAAVSPEELAEAEARSEAKRKAAVAEAAEKRRKLVERYWKAGASL